MASRSATGSDQDWTGKAALITGAASGIGAALGETLVARGASVLLSDIDSKNLEATASRIGAASAVCDVSDDAAVDELVEHAWSELGSLDLLCANAGVIVPGSLLEISRKDLDFIFGVNVWGVVHACRAYARKLRENDRAGYMLLTGSEHSLSNPSYLRAAPLHAYNMTKHAVLSIGESMRAELGGEGVGVSVLCPGPVESGLAENSESQRPTRFGPQPAMDLSRIDPAEMKNLGDAYVPASRAAEIALRGIEAGAFIIPTHAFEREDVDARYEETVAGFALLD